jgi:hypothetical protein
MGDADLIARRMVGIPTNIRLLTAGATATYDDVQTQGGTVIRLRNVGANIIRYKWTETLIADGDFEERRTWEASSTAPFAYGADGVQIRGDFGGCRPTWIASDPSLVVARYSDPAADAQYGKRDMDMALSDTSLRVWTHSLDKLAISSVYSFRFYHQETHGDNSFDYAIVTHRDGVPYWLQSTGGSWATTEAWIAVSGNTTSTQVNELFTTDTGGNFYSFGFRPTSAHSTRRSYIDRVSCIKTAASPDWTGIMNNTIDKVSTPPTYIFTPRGGNLSLIQVTGASVLEVAEMRG